MVHLSLKVWNPTAQTFAYAGKVSCKFGLQKEKQTKTKQKTPKQNKKVIGDKSQKKRIICNFQFSEELIGLDLGAILALLVGSAT